MQNQQLTIKTDLTDLDLNAWFAHVDEVCDEHGFFEPLGNAHFAGFLEAGNKLLVTFEDAEKVRQHNAGAEPRGFAYAREDGWSVLCILSMRESWFRDRAIFDFFDRMTDDGFFEDFEQVIFHGSHAGGYAAAAYSVAAPGATVIALRPQATLDARIAGWDSRYRAHRTERFDNRYGYAPDMIDGAEAVFVSYDPYQRLDAMHAALFRGPNVALLPAPLIGAQLGRAFDRMNIHDVMIRLAADKALTTKRFSQLLRARRYDATYARTLVKRLMTTNHLGLARVICEYKIKRGNTVFFEKALRELGG